MGMFDFLKVEVVLPDNPPVEVVESFEFQTKSFDCTLELYTITSTGRLIYHQNFHEWVEDAEAILGGYYKWLRTEDVDTNYHGDVVFYNEVGDVWYQYLARFTDGQLQWIEVSTDPDARYS